jgi:hypothetical protein
MMNLASLFLGLFHKPTPTEKLTEALDRRPPPPKLEEITSETSLEIYQHFDFKKLFKEFDKGRKKKLTPAEKRKLRRLVKRCIPITKGDLQQGAPLQVEDLSTVMSMVTYDTESLKLKKENKNGKQVA